MRVQYVTAYGLCQGTPFSRLSLSFFIFFRLRTFFKLSCILAHFKRTQFRVHLIPWTRIQKFVARSQHERAQFSRPLGIFLYKTANNWFHCRKRSILLGKGHNWTEIKMSASEADMKSRTCIRMDSDTNYEKWVRDIKNCDRN